MENQDYLKINKELWNAKVPIHVGSAFYEQEEFLAGKSSLKDIELHLLGDVKGKDILHLQCHFGQDTLSLARMGANVTGIDLSDEAIKVAQKVNIELGLEAKFICADVYSAPEALNKKFDIVYTTYGVLGWLPELESWAQVVKHFLKPGGKLILVEFHPFVWTLDENFDHVKYFYFNKEDITEIEEGTYADRYSSIKYESISWNHSFSEVFQSILDAGMHISHFDEYDYSPYACFNRLVEIEKDKFQVEGLEGKIPMVYSLIAKA